MAFSLLDLVGIPTENVFRDVFFLAKAMLGKFWPPFFTCQLFSLVLDPKKENSFYDIFLDSHLDLWIWIHIHYCLKTGDLSWGNFF